jgi:hypothetical protein
MYFFVPEVASLLGVYVVMQECESFLGSAAALLCHHPATTATTATTAVKPWPAESMIIHR